MIALRIGAIVFFCAVIFPHSQRHFVTATFSPVSALAFVPLLLRTMSLEDVFEGDTAVMGLRLDPDVRTRLLCTGVVLLNLLRQHFRRFPSTSQR